jgi:hypothetical protein
MHTNLKAPDRWLKHALDLPGGESPLSLPIILVHFNPSCNWLQLQSLIVGEKMDTIQVEGFLFSILVLISLFSDVAAGCVYSKDAPTYVTM